MRFPADMNLSPLTVAALAAEGMDIARVSDLLRVNDQPSLVTLRLLDTDPAMVTERLREVLPQIEAVLSQGCAATVEDSAVRVRRLPIR